MKGFSDYGGNNSPWRNSVKFAVIEEGVTNISNYAFFCCENLVSIEIPNGVTNIGLSAFNFCENLKSVLLPNTLETIEDGAFAVSAYVNAEGQNTYFQSNGASATVEDKSYNEILAIVKEN